MPAKSPLEMLYHWESTQPEQIYLQQPVQRQFKSFSWYQVGQQVRRLANALIAQTFPKSRPIALFSKN